MWQSHVTITKQAHLQLSHTQWIWLHLSTLSHTHARQTICVTIAANTVESLLSYLGFFLERDWAKFCVLSQGAHVAVQWIPIHCGLVGNDEANKLAKHGNTLEQQNSKLFYREAKTLDILISNTILTINTANLQWPQRRTGHNFPTKNWTFRLKYHVYQLGLSHIPDFLCDTGPTQPGAHPAVLAPPSEQLKLVVAKKCHTHT